MEIVKTDNGQLLKNIEIDKLFNFLKCQISADVIFVNKSGEEYFEILHLEKRILNHIKVDGLTLTYKDLLSKFSEIINLGYELTILIDENVYQSKFSLITLIKDYDLNPSIVEGCIYIDYNNHIFEIISLPLPNGDSSKIYYFEQNDTILGFSEDGPHLITDNEAINSVVDIICI